MDDADPAGRVIGLDLGLARMGVAVTDERRLTTRPLGVIPVRGARADARALRAMIEGMSVSLLVVGVPLLPSGDESDSSRACRERGQDLARRLQIPVAFVDESDTTLEAERILRERPRRKSGGPEGSVDAIAAALILEAWLADQGRLA